MDILLVLLGLVGLNVLAVGVLKKGWVLSSHVPNTAEGRVAARSFARVWAALVIVMDAMIVLAVVLGLTGLIR